MLFTSYEFLIFAAIVLLAYYLIPKKAQWCLLLAASYLFYSFADVRYLIFIVSITLTAYFTAKVISRKTNEENLYVDRNRDQITKEERKAFRSKYKKKKFHILVVGLVIGFGFLAIIKYSAFTVSNINSVLHIFGNTQLKIPHLLLPMGISFYTFQSMGYLIDVYRGKAEAENNLAKFALFVSFFPQLIQGPISRYNDLAPQLLEGHSFNTQSFVFGLERVLWGYFKKLVVADRMLIAVRSIMDTPEKYGGVYVFLLIIFYSIEIYADFTGGIDITIGLAESLGIRLAENFRHPFFSKSIKEYWRRWHITMGTWFSDYIFYPLSVSRPMQKLSKKCRQKLGNALGKRIPVYLATLLTWLLTGLWHGAGWNFIVWGLLNAVIILISQELTSLYRRFHDTFPKLENSKAYASFSMSRTFLLMGTIRILDCYRNVPLTFRMIGSIFYTPNWGDLFNGKVISLGLGAGDYVLIAVCCILMFTVSYLNEKKDIREIMWKYPVLPFILTGILITAVIIFGAYGIGYDKNQFIYNQF